MSNPRYVAEKFEPTVKDLEPFYFIGIYGVFADRLGVVTEQDSQRTLCFSDANEAEVKARELNTRQLILEFNNPRQYAVAIDTTDIGDDNCYSCFIRKCVEIIYNTGEKERALKLMNTDSLLVKKLSLEEMEDHFAK